MSGNGARAYGSHDPHRPAQARTCAAPCTRTGWPPLLHESLFGRGTMVNQNRFVHWHDSFSTPQRRDRANNEGITPLVGSGAAASLGGPLWRCSVNPAKAEATRRISSVSRCRFDRGLRSEPPIRCNLTTRRSFSVAARAASRANNSATGLGHRAASRNATPDLTSSNCRDHTRRSPASSWLNELAKICHAFGLLRALRKIPQ